MKGAAATTSAEVVRCPACGAKNRLKATPEGQLPACGRCGASLPWLEVASDGDFDERIRASVPVLVDFWAEWCGPCHMIDPAVREMARDYPGKLKVVKLNIDDNPATAGRFRVMSIPTLILFEQGEAVETIVGAVPKHELVRRVAGHLAR